MSDVIDKLNQFNDPRDSKKVIHPLATILFIAVCAIFCGAEGWEDIVLWAESHQDWLKKYVDLSGLSFRVGQALFPNPKIAQSMVLSK